MKKTVWHIRLFLCQTIGVLDLAAYQCLLHGRNADASMESFYLSIAAESILLPLGICLVVYVMCGLGLHMTHIVIKIWPVRATLGIIGILPVLGYILGGIAYWNNWKWASLVVKYYFEIQMLRGLYQPVTLVLLCVDMLLIALAIETKYCNAL